MSAAENKKFIPDDEFVKFATGFSNKYLLVKAGYFTSEHGKYHIDYHEKLIGNMEVLITCGRVGLSSGKMQLDKEKLSDPRINSDMVFYIILWLNIEFFEKNRITSHDVALDFYTKLFRRDIQSLIDGYTVLMANHPANSYDIAVLDKFKNYPKE